jgi:phytoene dehydrogenase-like protein
MDWALDGPIPWSDPLTASAATVHVGGTYTEVESAERQVFKGKHSERPFVLLAQQSLFDDTRAPDGKHTAWGYCHVPNGSDVDMTDAAEHQIERFAPGFKDLILERSTMSSTAFESYNPNYVGGDIGGGGFGLKKILQMGAKRPYQLGDGVYLCSSAAPPGAGVHGMCGYHAARAALD